ncbi:MAG: 3-oxosteroid 1-dehydrogenase [Rugosibacter sp.]|nr:3-oxosteroid 1-dehydrogenase [Rugosibacter sp.]
MTNRKSEGRRNFIKGAAAAVAVGVTPLAVVEAEAKNAKHWDMEADVVVVGSGAAASSAALFSSKSGASVIMLEKLPIFGGTTAKSDGVFWIPNNPLLKQRQVSDPRDDAIRYMIHLSYPHRYNPKDPRYGVEENEYNLIAAFYDNASDTVKELVEMGALKIGSFIAPDGDFFPDYYALFAENKVPRGRGLFADVTGFPERAYHLGGGGNGAELIRQLRAAFDRFKIKSFSSHAVQRLIKNGKGEVIGVDVTDTANQKPLRIRARKGVIFGSGGFTHNLSHCNNFLRGPIFGGCATPGSTGDFVNIGEAAGAALGNMNHAWWAQTPVEMALKNRSTPAGIWTTPGDSAIQVDRYGRRVLNEKMQYNERTQVHFEWDPVRGEYKNLVLFLIYDQRTADLYSGMPIQAQGALPDHVISGATLAELTTNIQQRLERLSGALGGFGLDATFVVNLKQTIERFNGFAESGKDADFHRGETPVESAFQFFGHKKVPNPFPNMTMHPIAGEGPYYAVLLGAGTLDTKGGPRINDKAQVLDPWGKPIVGLYAAGNCTAHPAGQGYWGGGGTIGPALTFGRLAATNATKEPVKSA